MPIQILAVDDIESNLVALAALLQDKEVNVVCVRSGREAVDALRKGDFSLVLLDIQMPDMDGFETAAAMRMLEKVQPTPIIFVTAYGSTKVKLARAYSVGASDLLEKPIDPAALHAKVRAVVELSRRVDEAKRAAEERHRKEIIDERARWEAEERVRQQTEQLRKHAHAQETAAAVEHRARLEAEDANRLKDEFLATLSHELRTPLNAILGWTAILRARGADAASVARAVDVIERNAKAQTKLIDDLLDISRIVAGKLRLEGRPVLLSPLVERAVESFRPAADRKQVALELHIEPEIPAVSGDADRLQQVVSNLLSNAVKFTPAGGRIEVRLNVDDRGACVRVSDTGEGIPSEFLPHLFDRFRQRDGASTRSHGGLGVGLSLARHLVELHGGTITAGSEGAGRGATFTVTLPIESTSPPDGQLKTTQPAVESLTNVRVLVVDDDADAREILRELLEQAGATVAVAPDARQALAAVSSWKPDVLISDIGMPEMDGYTLVTRVRALPADQGGQIPALALSAYASLDDPDRARRTGFSGFMRKPVDAAELVAEVAALSRGRTPGRSLRAGGWTG